MKYTYLSTNDIGQSLSVVDGKVEVSSNYVTVAESDVKYQPSGDYTLQAETDIITTRLDGLGDIYQIKGEYLTQEFADERYAIKTEVVTADVLTNYVENTELATTLADYATKTYVDNAIITGGGGGSTEGFDGTFVGQTSFTGDMDVIGNLNVSNEITATSLYDATNARQILISDIPTRDEIPAPGTGGEGFDGNFVGDSVFDGSMEITGELTLPSLYDSVNSRQILVSKLATLDDIPSGTGGEAYVLPTATDTVLGGVKIGNNIDITDGTISVTFPANNDYTLPIASDSVLGGVKIGSGITIDGNGVISASSSSYTLPIASGTVLGGVKAGDGILIDANGVASLDRVISGPIRVIGDLTVSGDITYTGELTKVEGGMDYRNNSLKILFEHGELLTGTPKTNGEITYNPDGTFSDTDGGYSGKLTAEGYLDLSVENKIKTSLVNANMLGVNCFGYVEIIGKLNSSNSIYAPLVRTDKATGTDTYLGTKNGTATNSIGTNAMHEGLNRLVFVPTGSGTCAVYANGVKYTASTLAMAKGTSATDTDIYISYCWAAGGTGLLKKCAIVSYADFNPTEDDFMLLSTDGFKDSPAPVLKSLSLQSRIASLEESVGKLKRFAEKGGYAIS